MHWQTTTGFVGDYIGDVVITRDDDGATGRKAFLSLMDPGDGKPGRIIAQNRYFPFAAYLGKQQIGTNVSLAVDPNNSAVVYVAWADQDNADTAYTIHLRKSADRGQNWSEDLLAIPSATNPALAVADDGTVGLLYQQLAKAGNEQESRWETHLRMNHDNASHWTDMVLATFPSNAPEKIFDPYLGDKIQLVSVANHFYGVFSSSNDPDPHNFPQGVRFQRKHKIGQLLSKDGQHNVKPSIDPFFFDAPPYREAEVVNAALPVGEDVSAGTTLAATKTFWPILVLSGLLALGLGFSLWWIKYCVPENVKGAVDWLFDEKVQGPVLANYTGFVTATLTDANGQTVQTMTAGTSYQLRVRVTQEQPDEAWAQPINISSGEDAPQVVFRVTVDSDDFKVTPDRKTLSVPAKGSADATFDIVAPDQPGDQSLFIQLFQKTRLIQVVAPTLSIQEPEGELST